MVITVPANDGISGEVKFLIKYIGREPGFCDSYEVIAAAGADSLRLSIFGSRLRALKDKTEIDGVLGNCVGSDLDRAEWELQDDRSEAS